MLKLNSFPVYEYIKNYSLTHLLQSIRMVCSWTQLQCPILRHVRHRSLKNQTEYWEHINNARTCNTFFIL